MAKLHRKNFQIIKRFVKKMLGKNHYVVLRQHIKHKATLQVLEGNGAYRRSVLFENIFASCSNQALAADGPVADEMQLFREEMRKKGYEEIHNA